MQLLSFRIRLLLAPVPALLLLLGALLAGPGPQTRQELENAGFVLNGRRLDERIDKGVDRALARQPRLLVLGNSNANTDIDPVRLGGGLGVGPREIVTLTIPNSSTAHWVAILRRALGSGARPQRVLVVSRLQLMLVRRPISEGASRSLRALLHEGDDDLREVWPLARWRDRRELLRERTLRALRGALPRLWWGVPSAEPALHWVLADHHLDPTLLRRPAARPVPDPEDSLLPQLLQICHALGAQLTLVRPPPPPLLDPESGDIVPDEQIQATRELVHTGGAELLDLAGIFIPPGQYRNLDHLDPEGASRLTGALLPALRPPRGPRVGALGEIRVVEGVVGREQGAVAFRGQPPAVGPLPELVWEGQHGRAPFSDPRWPDDDWTRTATLLKVRCSPLRLSISGSPLETGLHCEDMQKIPHTSCHSGGSLRVHAEPGPVALSLDPERGCDGARWLYPGDEATISWPSSPVLAGPLDRLEVDVAAPEEVPVLASLRVGGREVAGGEVPRGRGAVFPLGGLVPDGEIELVLSNAGHVAVLATRAELIGR
jgi:hypothetical protein